jgi:cardiolipin synthase
MASRNKNENKIFWLLIILFIPLAGIVFYMMFGATFLRTRRFKNMPKLSGEELSEYVGKSTFPLYFKYRLRNELDFINFIDNVSSSPINFGSRTEILTNGDEKFKSLFEKLEEAEDYIHFQYFIIHEGVVATQLQEILIRKASQGVKVRLLFDDVGSIDLSKEYKNSLIEAGIEVEFYSRVSIRMIRSDMNYRNHRKIVVVDGKYGFTGGINIGDEYMHLDEYYGFWRDTHIMIEGTAVKCLNMVFMSDWYNVTSERLFTERYLKTYPVRGQKHAGVQVIKDGPDVRGSVIKDIYFKAIMEAQVNIRIATPYLILEDDILKALRVAALSGVKVEILVPGKPDWEKNLVYLATQSYFERLLEAGCKIYTYSENFMHSKFLIIDEKIASIGTANLDFRSFHLNFEVTTLLYLDPSISKLISDFEQDLTESDLILLEDWQKRKYYRRWLEAYAKLFSPML